MSVPPRSVFCQFFVSCQDSCEPVIISGVMRITSPGPTSAPGPGGGEVSGSGSQALAAGWMWLDPGDSFRGSWERGGVSPPVSSLGVPVGGPHPLALPSKALSLSWNCVKLDQAETPKGAC